MIRYKNVYPTFRMIVLKFQYVSKLTVQSNRRLWRPRHSLRSQLIIYYYQLFGVYLAIAQSSTYCCTEFRILRNSEFHTIKSFGGREHTLTLRKESEIANHNKLLYTAAKRRQNCGTTNRLQYHPYQSKSNVFARGIALCISPKRSDSIHWQSLQRIGTDVLYKHIDM